MPMGTPETVDTSGYKFDPFTGQPINGNTTPAATQEVQQEETTDENFTHYVHLADGRVLKSRGSVTRWHDSDNPADTGVSVIGVYPR